MLFGAAYYPEHRPEECWAQDLDLMREADVNCLRVGEFAWSRFEPQEGVYDLEWMDRFRAMAAERGIRLLMCPPIRTTPAWLVEKDPGVLIEKEDGVRLEFGSRYTFCINHPLLWEKGEALAVRMAETWGQSADIAGWHLDNEHGDEPDCHCPICRKAFQKWCEGEFGEIAALNDAWGLAFWGLQFSKWEQIPTPRVSKTFHSPGHLQSWRRFRSDSTVDLVALQADAIRRSADKAQFITTNNQALWNNRTDYYEMARKLDVCGTNYYPPYGDNSRRAALGLATVRSYRQQNFQVHELRNSAHMIPGANDATPAPGEVERLTLHCVGNGADGIFYFRWDACPFGCEQSHGTIQDFAGRPRRVYTEVQRLGKWFKENQELLAGTNVVSDVAVLYDFPSRWVTETGVSWNGPKSVYVDHCRKAYEAVRNAGYNCDAVGREQDFSRYRVVVVPMLPTVTDELVEKLAAFVEKGGTLIWHPFSGLKDEHARVYPERLHEKLVELIGVRLPEFVTLGSDESVDFTWQGRACKGTLFCDICEPTTASVVGEFQSTWYAGKPAVTENSYGAGTVRCVMTFGDQAFYRAFLVDTLKQVGLAPCLDAEVPDQVEVCRRTGEGKQLLFLLNHSAAQQKVVVNTPMRDIYNGVPITGEVLLQAFGTAVLIPG